MVFNSDIKIRGKHATYAKFLCKDRGQNREKGVNVFDRVVDLYLLAPIVALQYGLTSSSDTVDNDTSTIQYSTVEREKDNLMYVFRMVIMCDVYSTLSDIEKVEQAFKYDDDEDEHTKKNIEVFQKYLYAGIEKIYEIFEDDWTEGNGTNEVAVLDHMQELITEFDDDNDEVIVEDY